MKNLWNKITQYFKTKKEVFLHKEDPTDLEYTYTLVEPLVRVQQVIDGVRTLSCYSKQSENYYGLYIAGEGRGYCCINWDLFAYGKGYLISLMRINLSVNGEEIPGRFLIDLVKTRVKRHPKAKKDSFIFIRSKGNKVYIFQVSTVYSIRYTNELARYLRNELINLGQGHGGSDNYSNPSGLASAANFTMTDYKGLESIVNGQEDTEIIL